MHSRKTGLMYHSNQVTKCHTTLSMRNQQHVPPHRTEWEHHYHITLLIFQSKNAELRSNLMKPRQTHTERHSMKWHLSSFKMSWSWKSRSQKNDSRAEGQESYGNRGKPVVLDWIPFLEKRWGQLVRQMEFLGKGYRGRSFSFSGSFDVDLFEMWSFFKALK